MFVFAYCQDSSVVYIVLRSATLFGKFAAAKTHIQFYVIERGSVGHPRAVGSKILLDTMAGRVRLLFAAVNLHKILRAVESYLPQELLPVDQLQVSPDHRGYIREL